MWLLSIINRSLLHFTYELLQPARKLIIARSNDRRRTATAKHKFNAIAYAQIIHAFEETQTLGQ